MEDTITLSGSARESRPGVAYPATASRSCITVLRLAIASLDPRRDSLGYPKRLSACRLPYSLRTSRRRTIPAFPRRKSACSVEKGRCRIRADAVARMPMMPSNANAEKYESSSLLLSSRTGDGRPETVCRTSSGSRLAQPRPFGLSFATARPRSVCRRRSRQTNRSEPSGRCLESSSILWSSSAAIRN